MYLQSGEKMTMSELLYGLMLSSGNDAAVAIAETVGSSQEDFVRLMNEKAQSVSATATSFTNPNGLPDENHFSTARDMAAITACALSNPVFAEIVATKSYTITGEGKAYPRSLSNHNRLLKMYDGCIGVKTGFTKAAGRCLVSAAQRDGMTLICVTLHAPDDWNDHIALFNYGFENYHCEKLIDSSKPICAAEVSNTTSSIMPVYAEKDLYYPLTEDEKCESEIKLYPSLTAPIAKGDKVGEIHFTKNGDEIFSASLIAGTDAETPSPIKKLGTVFAERLSSVFEEWAKFISGLE